MGQKTHPLGFRLGVVKGWKSRWFAEKDFRNLLKEDVMLRRYIRERLLRAAISDVTIERASERVTINIHTARPGIVIGRRGVEVDRLREELKRLTNKDVQVNIQEVKRPELDAYLVAENVVRQLEQRVSTRRAMRKVVSSTMRAGAEGIRVRCGGRLGGAEMARVQQQRDGRVPLHTLRADIDFARLTAFTGSGTVGVKVWICNGEILDRRNISK